MKKPFVVVHYTQSIFINFTSILNNQNLRQFFFKYHSFWPRFLNRNYFELGNVLNLLEKDQIRDQCNFLDIQTCSHVEIYPNISINAD